MIRLAIAALVSAAVAYWAGREHEYRITQRQGLDAGDDIDQPVHVPVDPRAWTWAAPDNTDLLQHRHWPI